MCYSIKNNDEKFQKKLLEIKKLYNKLGFKKKYIRKFFLRSLLINWDFKKN